MFEVIERYRPTILTTVPTMINAMLNVEGAASRNLSSIRFCYSAGEALPIFGAVVYLDHAWDSEFSSALGWSMTNITNSDAELPTAFHNGQYASTNLLWTPTSNVMMGGELQYSRRENRPSDNFSFNDWKLQFSFKYMFSQKFGGTP